MQSKITAAFPRCTATESRWSSGLFTEDRARLFQILGKKWKKLKIKKSQELMIFVGGKTRLLGLS